MKNQKWILNVLLAMGFFATVFTSCKKDDNPSALTLTALTSGGVDLNGAASSTNVPVDADIVATFSSDVDASTATASNITLTRDIDGAVLPITVTSSGNTVTINPTDNLGSGTLYKLSIGAGLKASNGGLFTATDKSFTSAGTYAPADVMAFWNFDDGTANAVVGGYAPSEVTDITYVDGGHNALSGKAAQFNGTTSYIDYADIGPSLTDAHSFSLSFWVYTDTVGHVDGSGNKKGFFVMGTGGYRGFQYEIDNSSNFIGSCKMAAQWQLDTFTTSQDLWFPADGNVGFIGWTFCKDLTTTGGLVSLMGNTWANVVCEYDGDTKIGSMYINNELMKQQDYNLYGYPFETCQGLQFDESATDVGKGFVLGFCYDKSSTLFADVFGQASNPDANHFQGMLDDVRIYHRALTTDEIALMYNSSK